MIVMKEKTMLRRYVRYGLCELQDDAIFSYSPIFLYIPDSGQLFYWYTSQFCHIPNAAQQAEYKVVG